MCKHCQRRGIGVVADDTDDVFVASRDQSHQQHIAGTDEHTTEQFGIYH